MNVLLLGSGAREHALAWKLNQSKLLSRLFIAPGNAGTTSEGENVDLDVLDFTQIANFITKNNIDVVIVGPEQPLVKGIHDFIAKIPSLKDVLVIGPQKQGAQLEGSKEFAKQFMERHAIPTAAYKSFTSNNLEQGFSFLETLQPPYVLKADGLAAGKGVLILSDLQEAKSELKAMLCDQKFGQASATVVIEAFLDGIELSCFALTDGSDYVILPSAKDYKRIGLGDTGLNTGGMGAISPVPFADDLFLKKVEDRIIKPTVQGLKKDNIPYVGFLFFGLIKVGEDPFVIEYNCRLGDPETEVIIPRLKTDLLALFESIQKGTFGKTQLEFTDDTAAAVMLVSGGYPEAYTKGEVIYNLDKTNDSLLFHAGTTRTNNSDVVTNGGRVLAITSLGSSLQNALSKSFNNAEIVDFENKYYRNDIGFDVN